MRLSLITAPTKYPVTLEEAKAHLRLASDFTSDDAFIDAAIVAATERAELETNRAFVTQTWELKRDAFPPCEIEVPRPPLLTVVSLTYIDTAGDTQTLSSSLYQVDAPAGPYAERGRVAPVYGETWPQTRPETFNAVVLRFTAGYGAAANVPAAIKAAIKMIIGHLYETREVVNIGNIVNEIPLTARNLLVPFKSRAVQH